MRKAIVVYYSLQSICWGLVALQQILISVVFNDFRLNRSLFIVFLSCCGFALTHFYRVYALHNQIFAKRFAYQIRVGITASLFLGILMGLVSYYGAVLFLLKKKTLVPDMRLLSIALNCWILIGSWIFLYHLYQYFQQLLQKSEEKWQLQKNLQEIEMDLLKLQINPHFLFNTLNTIRALLIASPDQAKIGIQTLGKLLMGGYLKIGFGKIPLKQELEIVKQYMTIEKLRFGEKLDFQMLISEEVENLMIPAGILLTLIENAVKHGFKTNQGQNKIHLTIEKQESQLLIFISNVGTLSQNNAPSEPSGVGLQNVIKRLHFYFQNAFNIQQTSIEGFVHTKVIF